jgi:hypothetical protein
MGLIWGFWGGGVGLIGFAYFFLDMFLGFGEDGSWYGALPLFWGGLVWV